MTSPSTDLTPTRTDEEISLSEIWAVLASRARLIVATTVISAGIAAGVALWMTPIFRAEVVLAVVDDSNKGGGLGALSGQFGGLASLTGLSVGGSTTRIESLGTLSSNQLLQNYISRENLMPILFESQWDQSRNDWQSDVNKKPTLWQATQLFSGDICNIAEDKKTGLVTLSIEWKDAATATKWANDLVSLVNKVLRDRAIEKSEENLRYLNAQLETTSVVELRQAIYRLIESEVKNVMVAQGNADYAFKVIDPAVVPEKKIKPKRTLMVALGAFLGLVLSSLYVLMRGERQVSLSI